MEKLKQFTEEKLIKIILKNLAYNKLVNKEASALVSGIQYDICEIDRDYKYES